MTYIWHSRPLPLKSLKLAALKWAALELAATDKPSKYERTLRSCSGSSEVVPTKTRSFTLRLLPHRSQVQICAAHAPPLTHKPGSTPQLSRAYRIGGAKAWHERVFEPGNTPQLMSGMRVHSSLGVLPSSLVHWFTLRRRRQTLKQMGQHRV